MDTTYKQGRMTNQEMRYISENARQMSPADIAKHLNRKPDSIADIIDRLGLDTAPKEQKGADIKNRSFWPMLQKQFSEDECRYIEDEWSKIYRQFKEDVTPTEEMQIIDMIKLDVMMHRMLIKKEQERIDSERIRQEIRELKLESSKENAAEISALSAELSLIINSQNVGNKEYRDLQNEKNKIMRDMKSTRDQRYQRIEASAESMKAWMADLISNDDKRLKLGRYIEKIRLASLDEEIRLAALHKYEDGFVDQPLLTPDTVKDVHDII